MRDDIPNVQDEKEWQNLKIGAWFCFENNPENELTQGKLYNWYALNDPRGLASKGYKMPTHYDWLKLKQNIGGLGDILKIASDWNANELFNFNSRVLFNE